MDDGRMSEAFGGPLYVMSKPVGSRCNLRCDYCYYLEKGKLYAHCRKMEMSEALLERYVRELIWAQRGTDVLFEWHGGEPLLRGRAFFEQALHWQKVYGGGKRVMNTLQTNGTLLTDDWCRFFRDHGFLLGVSIDGPQWMHDAYRRSADGRGSWDRVMAGIEKLNRWGVEWNAMAVVNELTTHHPLEFYGFFKEIGAKFIQFTPNTLKALSIEHLALSIKADAVETQEQNAGAENNAQCQKIQPRSWGTFLCRLFDEWVKEDVGEYFIQLFDATLSNWCGLTPGVCSLAKRCGHAACMEFNGDVYSCDHFVYPDFKLGNLWEHSLTELMYSERQRQFGLQKELGLPAQCRRCRWLFACHGECPKNRFAVSVDGEPGLNYLCEGYRMFFEHVAPWMEWKALQIMRN